MQEQSKYAEAFELLRSGYHLQRKGKLVQAIRKYKASIKLLPTAEAHTYLAWALGLQGKYTRAISECYRAIQLDEDYGNAYNDLGYYLTLYKRYDEAIGWMTKALSCTRFEDRHTAHYNIGRAHEFKGEWSTAMKHYQLSIKMGADFYAGVDAILRLQGMMN
jgi:tetratricopeptide (TPR) repeat protein